MGRDNRNEMWKKHHKEGKKLSEKLKLIRKKLGITITPRQWNTIALPVREQMMKAIHPERFVKPQPAPAPVHPAAPAPAASAATTQPAKPAAAPAASQPTGKTAAAPAGKPTSAEPKKK